MSNGLLDFLQSASNAVAGNVAGPVDLLGMGLNKIGVPVGNAPFGGSEWMKRKGLMRDVQQGPARVLGETAGLLGPAMVTQFAPQIAGGLLRAGDNLAAPAALNRQAGAVKSPSVVFKSVSDSPEKWMAKQNAEYRGFDEIYSGKDLKLIHKMTDEAGYGDVVAIKNGKVIGTTFYGPHGTNAASKTLEGAVEVHPDFRRQGVATKMYDAIEKITGKKLSPADSKTPLADAFWRSRK